MKFLPDSNYSLTSPHTVALVVLAHPDDELMVGGLLAARTQRGAETRVVVATNGEASTRGDRSFVAGGQRWLEGSRALSSYGIRRENQHFLGLPDGQLNERNHTDELVSHLHRLLVPQAVQLVITPGEHGYDGHGDHRAVHTAVRVAAIVHAQSQPSLQLYGSEITRPDVLVAADPALKLRNLGHHASQFEIGIHAGETAGGIFFGVPVSAASRAVLEPYWLNLQQEGYRRYDLSANALPAQDHRPAEV